MCARWTTLGLNLVLDVPTDKRDFFGNVIYDRTSQFISTEMRKINVKDLPRAGKPDSFTGAVGQFDFDVKFLRISQVQPQIPKKAVAQAKLRQARSKNDKRHDGKGFIRFHGRKRT